MNYTFSYTINQDDYFQYNRYHIRNAPHVKRRQQIMRFVFSAVLIAIGAFITFINRSIDAMTFIAVFYIIIGLLYLIFYYKLVDFTIKRSIKRLQKSGRLHYDKEITYEFGDDFFREITPDSTSEVKYSMITRIAEGKPAEGKRAIYVYINLQQAHIIPLRVFADEQERDSFLQFLNSKI